MNRAQRRKRGRAQQPSTTLVLKEGVTPPHWAHPDCYCLVYAKRTLFIMPPVRQR